MRTTRVWDCFRIPKVLSSEYARFRPDIQQYIIRRILPGHSVILDPMAGTSPLIPFIEIHGYTAYLNDISPVHFYINRAKQYRIFRCYRKYGYNWFSKELLRCMASLKGKRLYISDKWIDDRLLHGLIQAWRRVEDYDEDIKILLKATIIMSVRFFSSITKTKNPTWFKPGGISSEKSLQNIIRDTLTAFDKYYSYCYGSASVVKRGRCIFSIQDAAELNLKRKVDIILTSPQYCNRLDTLRQYAPELYFLSSVGHTIPNKNVIGTTKVRDYKNFKNFKSDFEYLINNSKFANILLNKIKKSKKKNDLTYYLPYYIRYFSTLFQTFEKLLYNLSSEGKMYIVLQDNTHRGELIEIDKVLKELLRTNGWRSRVNKTWERHHLGLRNPSRDHAFVKRKQFEKLMVIWR